MSYDKRRDEVLALAGQLYSEANGSANMLATMAAQFKLAAQDKVGGALEVVGIVSRSTGRPVVEMTWGNEAGQIDVEAARAHALLILEAAQNAVTDAAIIEWSKKEMKLDDNGAALLIDALRTYRADRWGQPDLELEFQHEPPEEEGQP